MPKNIVLCCDGTANEFAEDRTSVVKLFFTLTLDPVRQVAVLSSRARHDGASQRPHAPDAHCHRGVAGMAFGYGLQADIRDAYVFLMRSFEEGDKVFLFGFSRGAYTARAVTSLLHMYGLMPAGNEPLVPYAIRMLMAIHNAQTPSQVHSYFKLAQDFNGTFSSRTCKPWFVGVSDTVSSVGWYENPVHLPYAADNPDIEIGRHAIAIDERRAFFRTNLWMPKPGSGPKDLKQVWFPGVHCDVGGGYPEAQSGLSKLALKWMLREAIEKGLIVDTLKINLVLGEAGGEYVKPDATADAHESLEGAWWLAELLLKRHYNWKKKQWERRANLGRRRTIPPNSLVRDSAFERGTEYQKRLPVDAIRVP